MRAVLLILILVIVLAIAAVATGLVNVTQTQPAQAPRVEAVPGGVAAQPGQAPRFEVDTGGVAIGTQERQVRLPSIDVLPADNRQGGAQPGNPQQTQPQPQPQQQRNVPTTDATQR